MCLLRFRRWSHHIWHKPGRIRLHQCSKSPCQYSKAYSGRMNVWGLLGWARCKVWYAVVDCPTQLDSIADSLFVLNWLSWQIVSDTNNNTDTETRCLVYTQLTLMTWICQLCSMTNTSEKYERTQQGNLLGLKLYGQCPYRTKTFQKGASLIELVTRVANDRTEVQ